MTGTAQQNTAENYLFPLIKKIVVNYWRLNGEEKSDENSIGKQMDLLQGQLSRIATKYINAPLLLSF